MLTNSVDIFNGLVERISIHKGPVRIEELAYISTVAFSSNGFLSTDTNYPRCSPFSI